MTETQEPSPLKNCRISTFFAEDSLVRVFQSLESGKDSTIPEERCSLRSLGSLPLKDLCFSCLKMFPDSCRMTAAGHLRRSLVRWMNWGTMLRDRCLTARISVFPNPGRECILSDILETNVPDKYYLSQSQMEKILSKAYPENKAKGSTEQTDSPAP